MYIPREDKERMAEGLADKFHHGNMVAFAKLSAELYETHDEYNADAIMRLVRRKFLDKNINRGRFTS